MRTITFIGNANQRFAYRWCYWAGRTFLRLFLWPVVLTIHIERRKKGDTF
jgi:uncharacterized MAPEG superfamily protein